MTKSKEEIEITEILIEKFSKEDIDKALLEKQILDYLGAGAKDDKMLTSIIEEQISNIIKRDFKKEK